MATDRKERGSYSLDEEEYAELLAGTSTIPGKVPLTARLAPPPGSSPQPFDAAAAWRTIPRPDDGSSPGSTTPLDGNMRRAAESSLGVDLGGVRVHQGTAGSTVADRHAAQAVTIGGDIFLGAQVDNSKNWVLAHELAHAAQQRDAAPMAQAKRAGGPSEGVHEQEADRAADAIMTGRPASVTPTGLQVARFAPESHRQATIEGLQIGFTAEEIGMIYASNWERDFSQAVPEIGQCVITWKAVQQSAKDNDPRPPDPGVSNNFKAAIDTLMAKDPTSFMIDLQGLTDVHMGLPLGDGRPVDDPSRHGNSLSGYKPWEHMDQPDEKTAAEANKRWEGKSKGVAGYICDTVAYLKDEMLAAVNAYRKFHDMDEIGHGIDNWKGAKRPAGYDPSASQRGAEGKDSAQPKSPRDPVAREAADMAKKAGAPDSKGMTAAEKELWQKVGHHMGRSMHAFEDFWAHSNWLELAKEFKRNKVPPKNEDMFTGTFGLSSQLHALGHKIKAMAGEFLADMTLMRKVYGRTADSVDKLKHLKPKTKEELQQEEDARKVKIFGIEFDPRWAQTGPGLQPEVPDEDKNAMGVGVGLVGEFMRAKLMRLMGYTNADFMCSETWLTMLQQKGDQLIKKADEETDEHGHGKIAKDQPEGEKDSSGAVAIAAKANEAVFGPLKGIMQEKDPKKAEAMIVKQIDMVDQFIAAPSDGHPLIGMVQPATWSPKDAAGGDGHQH